MKSILPIISTILLLTFGSCHDEYSIPEKEEKKEEVIDMADYSDWNGATHGNDVNPNYDVVFNQNEVLKFTITIDSIDWTNMQSNLSAVLGSKGFHFGKPPDFDEPMFVPCSVKFNDTEWHHVGIRFKGNSSLHSTFKKENKKLSFKLDFDEFEGDYPAIKNQRFYGFKQLNLKNNFEDASLMREKVGADLFRQFGLVSPHSSFCVVYMDYGSGPLYYGVYTTVEEVDDTVIKTQFTSKAGNLYKPDGHAASFAMGTYNTDEFHLKTNEETENYFDVRHFYDVINSPLRTSNVDTWTQSLETVFDVDIFLKYLAANNAIQNWDTYGKMGHNYYLYDNPENGLLTWIPWDYNEAFQKGKKGGALSFSMNEIDSKWPIIKYIIGQPEYESIYRAYLKKFADEIFTPAKMITTYSTYYELLKDYAYSEKPGYTFIKSDSHFRSAVESLKNHVQSRNNEIKSYLNN